MDPGDLLELTGAAASGIASSVRWEVVSPGLAPIGELDISAEHIVSIENNSNRNVKRQLSGLVLPPTAANDIDPFRYRLRPVWQTVDPGTGVLYEYPLGVFVFSSLAVRRVRYSADEGTEAEGNMGDLLIAFDQPLDRSVTYPAGYPIATAIAEQATLAGVLVADIEASGAVLGSPVAWVQGRDTRLKVVNELAQLAGFYSPWFDNRGVFTARTVPELGSRPPTFNYDRNPRIYDGTIVETSDALNAPNRYVVVDTSASGSPISGSYDVPAAAPHSIANRGYPVVKAIEVQGLSSVTAAQDAARAAALQDTSAFAWVEVNTAPEPRMDTFDVVLFGELVAGPSVGQLWRVQSWKLALAPGGPMAQSWRRVYQP